MPSPRTWWTAPPTAALLFPPFCDICLVAFSSLSQQQCESAAKRFLQLIKERIKQERQLPIRVLGPTKMGTGRLGGRFRYKLVIKCRFNRQFRIIMNDLLLQAYKDSSFSNVSFYADINGEII